MSRTAVALSVDHDRLFVLSVVLASGRVRIKSWLSAQMPQSLDWRDPALVGPWLAGELEHRGIPRAPAVVGVSRGEVALKWIRLPGQPADEGELASMVRLQMSRQLSMGMEGAATDYIPLPMAATAGAAAGSGSGGPAGGGGGGVSGVSPPQVVLAAALPGERMNWIRGVARSAGLKLMRVAPRASGAASLVGGVSLRHSGPVLAISVGWASVEFAVVHDGRLVFARSADVGAVEPVGDGQAAALASRVAVEAKRTWISYRAQPDSAEVDAVVVLGDGALARELAQRCGEALEMPYELVSTPGAIELPRDMPELERLVAAPLLGLLTEPASGRAGLNFATPRKVPDRRARTRQRTLLGALGVIVGVGGVAVWASAELARLRGQVSAIRAQQDSLQARYDAYLKEQARLEHVRGWLSAGRYNWLAHVRWITEQLPPAREAKLESFSASIRQAAVRFTPKDGRYQGGTWQTLRSAVIGLEGTVRSRARAAALRAALVEAPGYSVESRGADVPGRLSLQLLTALPAPVMGPPTPPASPRSAPPGGAGDGTPAGGADSSKPQTRVMDKSELAAQWEAASEAEWKQAESMADEARSAERAQEQRAENERAQEERGQQERGQEERP